MAKTSERGRGREIEGEVRRESGRQGGRENNSVLALSSQCIGAERMSCIYFLLSRLIAERDTLFGGQLTSLARFHP